METPVSLNVKLAKFVKTHYVWNSTSTTNKRKNKSLASLFLHTSLEPRGCHLHLSPSLLAMGITFSFSFWKVRWCDSTQLYNRFSLLFHLVRYKDDIVAYCSHRDNWSPCFSVLPNCIHCLVSMIFPHSVNCLNMYMLSRCIHKQKAINSSLISNGITRIWYSCHVHTYHIHAHEGPYSWGKSDVLLLSNFSG